jgi:ABC-type Fe3+ transport system substrate-binding protein
MDVTAGRGSASDRAALVVRGLTDPRSMRDIVWPAFQRDSGMAMDLDYRQEVDMGRLREAVAELPAGGRPDVLIVANPQSFWSSGLLAPVDGIGPRSIPAAWSDEGERAWALYVQPIVVVYNAHYAVPPARWTDVADARWQDRLVFEAAVRMLTTGPAFAELQTEFGRTGWTAWLTALAAIRPRQVADNERAVLEVATGSRWAGLSNWNVARRVRPGSPVRHVFLDPTPCIPGFGAVVEGAAWPEAARTLVRWLASEAGQRAYGATGRIPAVAPEGSSMTVETVLPPSVRPMLGTADWVRDPDPWVAAFESAIPIAGTASAGKLHTA